MNREKEILEYITPFFEKRFFYSCKIIQKEFSRNNKNKLDILKIINEKIILLQKEQNKRKIGYLYISYLRSSLLTQTYDFRIDFYDKNFYLDENPIYTYIPLDFIFSYYNNDIFYLIENMKKAFIRLQQYEIELVQKKYAFYYYKISAKFFADLADEIFNMSSFFELQMEKEVKVIFGEYMDKGILLYNYTK